MANFFVHFSYFSSLAIIILFPLLLDPANYSHFAIFTFVRCVKYFQLSFVCCYSHFKLLIATQKKEKRKIHNHNKVSSKCQSYFSFLGGGRQISISNCLKISQSSLNFAIKAALQKTFSPISELQPCRWIFFYFGICILICICGLAL